MTLSDRLKAGIEAFVTRLVAKYDYTALYPCTVVSQNADGTLELRPDSPNVPGLSRVPIRYGTPGVSATVQQGARVLLGFQGMDPKLHYAALWEDHDLVTLSLGGGTAPVARVGDNVASFFPPLVPVQGTLSGLPFVGVMTITNAVPGIIQTGAKKVLA